MKRLPFVALAALVLGSGSAWAASNLGVPHNVVTDHQWALNDPSTFMAYVPFRKSPADHRAASIPMYSPEYHAQAVAPTQLGYCQGCVERSTPYGYLRVTR